MPDTLRRHPSEVEPLVLDNEADRGELRDRYYGLLQEQRVVLPGVQVLLAFLLTAPFAQRFAQLDGLGKGLFAGALMSAMFSVIGFVAPIVLHRFGDRTARTTRLQFSIAATRAGLVFLALALVLALAVVARYLFDPVITVLMVGGTLAAMVALGILVARTVDRDGSPLT